jgi:hypothetical protein
MSDKFHINSKGEPGKCSAQHGGCPFGSAEDHYTTREAATQAFERSMVTATIPKLAKAPTRQQVNETLDAMLRGEDTIPEGVVFENIPQKEAAIKPEPPTKVETLLSETPKQRQARWAAVDAKVHENVVLFGQDEENLKHYNRFANRVRRLFSRKKDTLFERSRLDELPAGRKLIDYNPNSKDVASVWTKVGDNEWSDENGKISTDKDRKLPATIVS